MSNSLKVLVIGAGRVFKHYLYIIKKFKITDLEIVGIVNKKKIILLSKINYCIFPIYKMQFCKQSQIWL